MSTRMDGLDTLLAMPHDGAFGEMTPPIYQSSLFGFDSYAEFEDRMAGRSDRPLYSRVQNPTVSAFEQMIARLEGAEVAVGFASGMAAVASTLFALVKPGDRIACITHVYPDSYRLMERILRPWGIDITYHTPEAFETEAELLAGTRLAYLESPNSMMMEVMDLRRVAGHARRHGVTTVIDSSWATPALLNPVALGIDLVIHSASKYISGHSDTVAGVVTGRADLIARLRDLTLPLLGAKLAPFEAWLLLRGLRTLEARMRQHGRTADLFVGRLADRPEVTRVRSPGADAVPGLRGRSGLMSVEFADHVDIPRFADALKLFRLGVSWGGFESLVVPAAITLRQAGEQNAPQRFGVPPQLVRLSLGLEGAEDLWEDFMQALEVATG